MSNKLLFVSSHSCYLLQVAWSLLSAAQKQCSGRGMSKKEEREWVLGVIFQGAKGRQCLKTVGKPSPWGWSWQLALSLAARLLAGEAGADEFSTPCSRWRFMGCLFCSVEEKKEKDEGNTQCLRFPFCLATATKARAWRDWDFTGGV